MVKRFIEITCKDNGKKQLINVDRIISVIEQNDGAAFVEFYESRGKFPCGVNCSDGYEKVKCMLVDVFGGEA